MNSKREPRIPNPRFKTQTRSLPYFRLKKLET